MILAPLLVLVVLCLVAGVLVVALVLGGRASVATGLVQLSGPGLSIRSAARAWVTPAVATAMQAAGAAAGAAGEQLRVLDASREGGGAFPPHLSHQAGRDVDVRYPQTLSILAAASPTVVYASRERVAPLRAAGLPAVYWPGHVDHAHLRW